MMNKNNEIPRHANKSKSHEYNLDNRVFIVTPVYRNNGENTKDIIIKLMREEARDKNAKHRY